ncbi:MAG: mechanosensitive ion channel [Rikenellaceae bacterium]
MESLGGSAKFYIIQNIEDFLISNGVPIFFSDVLTFLISLVALYLIIVIIDYTFNHITLRFVHKIASKTATQWDDFLSRRNFFRNSIRFLVSLLMVYIIELLFTGFNDVFIYIGTVTAKLLAVFYITLMAFSFLDALHDIYNTKPRSKEKSIKSYIQTIKIILVLVAVISAMIVVFEVPFGKFFTGFAASAAIITLVFKDVILGFIASVQLSTQDMVRLGDWIEIPARNISGTVEELNINYVKIKNWDKTYTTLPVYTIVSESIVNWRGMFEDTGRRFKRQLFIDLNSVKIIENEKLEELKNSPLTSKIFEKIMELKVNAPFETESTSNSSLFRAYTEAYLRNNSAVNQDMTLAVRYLVMQDTGLPMEIYGFTRTKVWVEYERTVADITDHLIMVGIAMGIRFYQRNSNATMADNGAYQILENS